MASHFRKIFLFSGGAVALYTASKFYLNKTENKHLVLSVNLNSVPYGKLPFRNEQLKALQTVSEYDILVVGGGATGSGIALDSASRGLKTALVELDDFSSGTSSRSTKLIHGGVRYLKEAIMEFDREQFRLVKEALHERANVLAIAPHLAYPLPIMIPIYKWWEIPYFWVGMKMYDLLAWKHLLKSSYFVSRSRALELFPVLKKDNLCGGIIYYDGMHDDARMNLSIVMTAARMGANVANYVEVVKLLKSVNAEGKEKISGARVKDVLTGTEWDIHAKAVINATGSFADSIRRMDDIKCSTICQPSAGVHIVLPNYYCPEKVGLLDPSTSDGRVIFFLPWQKMTIAGTTDKPCELTHHPTPTEDEIQFILNEIKKYLGPEIAVRRRDVMSAWSGIRPLVLDPSKSSTEKLARNHIVHITDSQLITIVGGKWTTYRVMAKDAVDAAVKICNLHPKSECQTSGLLLEGASGWTPNLHIKLVQDYGFDYEVAEHLANTYGDQAFEVAKRASLTSKTWPIVGRRLHEQFPYIDAEVCHAVEKEYACTAIDVIARRLRLAFLNVQATEEVLPIVIAIMADILNWSADRQSKEYEKAKDFLLKEMGGSMNIRQLQSEIGSFSLSKEDVVAFTEQFESIDKDKKGYIIFNELKMHLLVGLNENMVDGDLHVRLNKVNLSESGQVNLEEYLLLQAALKFGNVTPYLSDSVRNMNDIHGISSVERSGGGVL